jgi:hypothetical protein
VKIIRCEKLCEKFMNVGTWKTMHVRLKTMLISHSSPLTNSTHHNIIANPIFIP